MATEPTATPAYTPRSSVRSMLGSRGFTDPNTAATGTTPTAEADGTDTAQNAEAAAETAAPEGEGATFSATYPLATSAASTAFTGATISPEADNSNGDDGGAELQEASGGGGMSEGTKIGIGVGVGVGVAVIIALIALYFVMRKRRTSNKYTSHPSVESMRGQPAMTSTEPTLGAVGALGRSQSYPSNDRSSYHSLSPTSPPPLPETAPDPVSEATKRGSIPITPTIIPPSQQSLPHEVETPRGRRSLEAEVVASPGNERSEPLATPGPAYDEAPSPLEERLSRPVSPVSSVSSMGSRPPSLRRSLQSPQG